MASLPRVAGEESTKACPEVQKPSHSHEDQIPKTDIEQCPLLSKYTTLDRSMRAFRVLRLVEDGYELHHVTLDDPPRYHAISHYWGPPDVLRPVMVDGEQVKIRQTTWFMLKSLYRNYDKVLVWLDMLCINQHDRSEREYQVGLMGQIYSNAASVHAWLGEHSINSEIPFQFALELHYNPVQVVREDPKVYNSWRNNVFGLAFGTIFVRPYWRRLWIVQELSLAKEIFLVCGTDILDLDCFIKAARFWDIYNWDLNNQLMTDGTRTFEKIIRDRTQPSSFKPDLIQCLHTYVKNECTNPRDKIYALRSLVPRLKELKVDYSKDILDVFVDVLQLGLLNLQTGCQAATLLFAAMGLAIRDMTRSIQSKSQDNVPFTVCFVYEIKEVGPNPQVKSSGVVYTSVDLYEQQSDKRSLLHRVKLRSGTIKRTMKGDYLCRLRDSNTDWVILRKVGLDVFTIVDFMSMHPFYSGDLERYISQVEATYTIQREGEGSDVKEIRIDLKSVIVLLLHHQGGFSVLGGLRLV